MTHDELEEYARNAHAQAMGAQSVLSAMIMVLQAAGTPKPIFEKAFDLAADTYVAASYSGNESVKADAPRILQVIDHMRQAAIPKD
jgi:hypothetical protein